MKAFQERVPQPEDDPPEAVRGGMKEALLYRRLGRDSIVRCDLCSHHCVIGDGEAGTCGVRVNRGGTLFTLVYNKAVALNVDPIEKKPLFHFHPGTTSLSLATVGCNFTCKFCQNYDISQFRAGSRRGLSGDDVTPETLVRMAKMRGCGSISYTYTEPTIFFEYAHDTAVLAHREGIKNVFVTNGFMSPQALKTIAPCLDAANVDLKSFSGEFYKGLCGARLKPVLKSIQLMREMGIWVEVTTLIIPGENDTAAELSRIAEFIVSVGTDVPWHISRFHPNYQMTGRDLTPVKTLEAAREIGEGAGLRYIYCGNVPGHRFESTFCHQCRGLLIGRRGFTVTEYRVVDSSCPDCRAPVSGVGV